MDKQTSTKYNPTLPWDVQFNVENTIVQLGDNV